MSSIEWTDETWNPVTGCTQISPGCENCYALRMSRRLQAMGQPNYRNGFQLTFKPTMVQCTVAGFFRFSARFLRAQTHFGPPSADLLVSK